MRISDWSSDVCSSDLTTPLHQAALVNDPASVLEFLEAGADPRATDRNGATFQDYLYDGDPAVLNAPTRKALEAIDAWLRSHGVPARHAPSHCAAAALPHAGAASAARFDIAPTGPRETAPVDRPSRLEETGLNTREEHG